jgi:hypothetical protein
LSAVQISGLPGNDRPVTHTVILRLGKIIHSGSVASWISSARVDPADVTSASLLASLTAWSGANSCRAAEACSEVTTSAAPQI